MRKFLLKSFEFQDIANKFYILDKPDIHECTSLEIALNPPKSLDLLNSLEISDISDILDIKCGSIKMHNVYEPTK